MSFLEELLQPVLYSLFYRIERVFFVNVEWLMA